MSQLNFGKNNPKAQQFTEELNSLLEKYQYTFTAELDVTVKGVVPILCIRDIIPAKEEKITPETTFPITISKKE